MKKEEKSTTKVIQLTNRESEALWKIKDKGFIQMSEMDDEHIQSALIVSQRRKFDAFNQLVLDNRLEEQLIAEAN